MSTIVYQAFQSCYESQVVEPWSLSLKLNPPKLPISQCLESPQKSPAINSDSRGWSCIEALAATPSFCLEPTCKEEVYVHPLIKRVSSKLSDGSLEMCTENLGCETGTDIIQNCFLSSPSPDSKSEGSTTVACQRIRLRLSLEAKMKARCQDFPPPLTSRVGSSSLLVRPHRERGRLVITAVLTSPRMSNIQTERSNGRLRMSLLDDSTTTSDFPLEERTVPCGDDDEEASSEMIKSDLTVSNETERWDIECEEEEEEEEKRRNNKEKEENGGEEEEEEGAEEGGSVHLEGDKEDGRYMEAVMRMGMGEFQRPNRCKEGGRGTHSSTRRLINWETFWVAISS